MLLLSFLNVIVWGKDGLGAKIIYCICLCLDRDSVDVEVLIVGHGQEPGASSVVFQAPNLKFYIFFFNFITEQHKQT